VEESQGRGGGDGNGGGDEEEGGESQGMVVIDEKKGERRMTQWDMVSNLYCSFWYPSSGRAREAKRLESRKEELSEGTQE